MTKVKSSMSKNNYQLLLNKFIAKPKRNQHKSFNTPCGTCCSFVFRKVILNWSVRFVPFSRLTC